MKSHLLLIAIVAVSACISLSLKDCGNDRECLQTASRDCSGAKGSIPIEGNTSFYLEVRGQEGNNCIVYERLDDPNIKALLDIINNRTGKSYTELSVLCKLPRNVTAPVTELSNFAITSYCEGPLIDLLAVTTVVRK